MSLDLRVEAETEQASQCKKWGMQFGECASTPWERSRDRSFACLRCGEPVAIGSCNGVRFTLAGNIWHGCSSLGRVGTTT